MSIRTVWENVNQGDVVEGSNGSLWSVLSITTAGEVTVLNVLTGREVTDKPAGDKPVVVVVKAMDALATAKALVTHALGGQEIATRVEKNGHGEFLCPVEIEHVGALYTHLLIFHGVYGAPVAGLPLSGLQALHTTIHDPAQRAGGYVPHVHDPAYAKTVNT